MNRHERSRGERRGIRKIKAAARESGESVYVAPPHQLSPTEQLQKDTFNQIRQLPKFRTRIRPHMGILIDFFETRMGILRGNDSGEAMQGFLERHPIMELENPVSTALAPATRLIRDRVEALAKTRK